MAAFKTIEGGFDVSGPDLQVLNNQRAITKLVNDKFIQVGAVFLKTSGKNPIDENWVKSAYRDTDLQGWIDDETFKHHNVGFNLQQGWVDIDIDADDPEYNTCLIAALDFLKIDTRFRFGRRSAGVATHVLVQLGEEEATNYEYLKRFEPKEFRIDGKRYHTQLRSYATNIAAANLVREAKQTVMPGSVYVSKRVDGQYDLSVWWGDKGIATRLADVAGTTPRKTSFTDIVRAITFGTFVYCLRDQWVEGNRQTTAQKITGWLARVVRDSRAMNDHEAVSADVFCPVSDESTAESLLYFTCEFFNDDEKHMRARAFNDACEKLERNPDAKIPGWPAIDAMLGGMRSNALRAVFMPGSDISHLTKMAERYVYDEADNRYLDRDRFAAGGNFIHEGSDLERRHKGDIVRVGNKPREAFRLFEASDMRKRVGNRDLYPELDPGIIYRISTLGDVMSDEDEDDKTSLTVFNTWRGWPVSPALHLDMDLQNTLVGMLDQVLGYLTRDKKEQIEWIKDWIAWTFQHPGIKQQIAWVVVGGQGVGKSWIGNYFLKALMGNLWGSASPKIMDGDFNIGPFKDKMLVFIDEAKFHSETGTDEIKKLIRNVEVPGMEKFMEARNYRIFSRIMFASNRFDMNIGQANTTDRALFYTRAYDKEFLQMGDLDFRAWTETLKPFFEQFTTLIGQRAVKEQFIRYFMDRKVDRYEIESIKFSSGSDFSIVGSNMSWARRIAKYIIEVGRIHDDLDISYPFTVTDFNRRVAETCKEMNMKDVQGQRVMHEFEDAGVLEKVKANGTIKIRFKYKLGTLTDLFGKAINLPLDVRYEFDEADMGENDNDGSKRTPWKGGKSTGVVGSHKF